ncbi:MAG: F0F1 ATP synthase subunit A [Bryobacteraceae bacterium]
MPEHELWVTAIFNKYLAGLANWILGMAGVAVENPDKPWANYVAMQIVVALIVVVVFAILRPRLSVDKPGRMQHVFEIIYQFMGGQADEVVGHGGRHYLHLFTTIFLFVLLGNLVGIIPTLESPTMFPPVPLGIALVTFCYYNLMGFKAQGVGGYLKHFAGPMPLMAPLMIPIEVISHCSRLLSLTVRLYANMFAGEQVTLVFLGLVPLVVPAVFMGLHVFVSFLQAFVFALLTMIYVSGAVSHEH